MINIDEARKLVHALDQDLSKVQGGSGNIQSLRDEVEALKALLETPEPGHSWVREALQSIHSTIEDGVAEARIDTIVAGRYIADIGRMLGL